jgi:PTH1 family peptidyl-tRNA hydrolase
MNLSGKAVNYWLQAEKIEAANMLVIVDDLALPFGTIRMKTKGSDAGHNGLADIAKNLGSTTYNRIRFGIGDDYQRGRQVDYVLSKFGKDEMLAIPERVDKVIEAIKSFGTIGPERTMNFFNGK